jgi:DNA repair protein RecO (recombination protein O)
VGSRAFRTEAVVLRSLRFGEADRIVHLFTRERGRVGAIAKGARRGRSRLGALLEPFSHVDIQLHEGRGDLATVTGADLLRSHQTLAQHPYRLAVGCIGLEAVLRLFIDHDPSPRAFDGLVRFMDLLDADDRLLQSGRQGTGDDAARPALDSLALSFQLKLLWLAGYLPHLVGCASCGRDATLVAFSAAAGGGVCETCQAGAIPVSPGTFTGMRGLLEQPLADVGAVDLPPKQAREVLRAVELLYEHHGGFRMRTLSTA